MYVRRSDPRVFDDRILKAAARKKNMGKEHEVSDLKKGGRGDLFFRSHFSSLTDRQNDGARAMHIGGNFLKYFSTFSFSKSSSLHNA